MGHTLGELMTWRMAVQGDTSGPGRAPRNILYFWKSYKSVLLLRNKTLYFRMTIRCFLCDIRPTYVFFLIILESFKSKLIEIHICYISDTKTLIGDVYDTIWSHTVFAMTPLTPFAPTEAWKQVCSPQSDECISPSYEMKWESFPIGKYDW